MASNGRFEYTIGFKTDDSGLKQARKALQDIQNLTVDSPGVTGVAENLENAKHAAAELETALTKAFNVKMGTTSVAKLDQELKNLNRPLSEIYEDMKSIGPAGETAFNKIAAQAMKTNLQIKQGNTILNKFGKTLWRNVEWLISGNLINTVTGVFTKAYGFTKNLDSSLNDIRIVTGKGADEMARFGKEAQETAARLGKGTTDITNASLIFYQQGLDKEEVNARTEVTAKMANVTNQSAETVADQMTAIWNGFRAGSDELEHYGDVMAAIAANTASSSSELAGAISKVSSIANTTGVDMEQLSAMISTVISVTRDSPETVGTAFKTIFARMDDLVEDGTDEFGVSLGRVSSHLAAMGIQILDEDGKLRDLGDTLTETGEKWSSYSREQQIAIAEQMGGKRQWNQVLALFDNWDKYRDALDVAKDSTGALQKQQDIYMESTQAHLQAVKTAWEGVYGEMMTADNINIVADTITKVLKVVQGFIQGVGGMGPIINALGATLLKAFSGQIAQNVLRISTNIKGMFYNINEQKAQQSLMAQFGALDSKLLQDMAKDHAKILNYQKDITKEQQDYYNKLIDSKIAADEEYRVLEEKKKKLDEILSTNKDINAVVQSKKGAVTTEGIGDLAIAKQAATQQIADTGTIETSTGRNVSLEMTENDQKQTTGLINMTSALDRLIEARQKDIQVTMEQIKSGKGNEEQLRQDVKNYDEVIKKAQAMQSAIKGYNDKNIDNSVKKIGQALRELGNEVVKSGKGIAVFKMEFDKFLTIGKDGAFSKYKGKAIKNALGSTDELAIYEAKIKDITKALDSMGKNNTKIAALSQKYKDLLASIKTSGTVSAEAKNSFQNLANETRQTMGGVTNDMKILIAGAADHIVEKFNSAKDRLSAITQQMKDFIKGLDFQHVAKTVTSTTAAVGQLASAIQMVNNLPSIWENMDASTGQKVTQTITTATAALGMFVAALTVLIPLIVKYLTTLSIVSIAKKAEDKIEAKNANTKTILRQKQVQLTHAYQEGTISIRTYNIGMMAAEKTAQRKIITDEMATKEIQKQVVATIALRAALIGLVAIIAAASIAAFIAVDSYNKETQAMKKEAEQLDKTIAENNKIIEQSKKVQEARKNWQDLWDSYEIGTTITEDMASATTTLVDTLEENKDGPLHYAESIAKLTGDYSGLNEEIERNLQLQNLQGMGAIEGNQTASKYSTGLKEEADVRENQTWYQEWVGIGDKWLNSDNIFTQGAGLFTKGIGMRVNQITGNDMEAQSAVSTGIDAEGNDDLLAMYKSIYGKHNVSINDDGQIVIDYEVAYQGMSEIQITEGLVTEREALEKQQKALEELGQVGSNDYGQISVKLDEINKKLATYDESIKAAKETAVSNISKADFKNEYVFDEELSKEQLAKQVKQAKEEYKTLIKKAWTDANVDFTDEELENAVNNNFKNLYPTEKVIIAQGEQFLLNTKSAYKTYEDKITAYMNQNNWASAQSEMLGRRIYNTDEEKISFSEQDFNKIKKSFQNTIKELTGNELTDKLFNENYDLSLIEGGLLADIIFGYATPEEFQQALNQAFTPPQTITDFTLDLHGLGNEFEEVSKKIKEGDLNGNNAAENKQFGELRGQMSELLAMFPENEELAERIKLFNDTTKMGTKEYAENIKWLQDYISDSPVLALNQQIDNVVEKWQNYTKNYELTGKLELDAKEFEQDLDKILDADREVNVEVKAVIDSNIEDIKTKFDNASGTFGKIGEGFTIAADDLSALQAAMDATDFQKLLDSAKVAADGTIQLNQEAVNSAMDAVKKQIDAEYELQDQKLAAQQAILEAKDAVYEDMKKEIDEKRKQNETEVIDEEDLNELIVQLSKDTDKLKLMNEDQAQIASDNIKKKDLAAYASFYTEVDAMDAKWNDNRTKRLAGISVDTTDWTGTFNDYDLYARYDKEWKIDTDSGQGGIWVETPNKKHGYSQEKVREYLNQLYKDVEEQQQANQEDAKGIQTQRDFLKIKRESALKTFDDLYKSYQKNTDATKDNTDATKDAAEAEQEMIDLLNEKIDAYHDVNVEIERNTTALNRLQKAQEKLTGKDLIKNYQEQIKQLDKLNNNLQEKQRLQYEEAVGYRVILEGEGITFNDDGTIANYGERLNQKLKEIQNDQIWYNSLSGEEQKGYKDWIGERQKEYDSLTEFIEKYDNLWNKTIPDLEDEISENLNQKLELTLTITKAEVEIAIEKGSIKRAELNLQKALNKIQENDIAGNLTYNIKTLFSYDESEEAQQLKEKYEYFKEQWEEALKTGDPSKDIQQAYQDSLTSYTEYIQNYTQQMQELITKSFDSLSNKIERQKTQFETLNQILEHDINIVLLKYGDKAYEQLETLYKAKEKIAQAQITNANLRIQAIQQALLEAQRMNIGEDTIQKYEDELASSLQAQHEMVTNYLDLIKEQSDRTIDEIFDNLHKQIAGVSLEEIKDQWDWINEDSGDYYDTVNGAYEIEKLRNQIQKAINETDSAATQKALNDLLDNEISNLQQKDKLSKYDIERAQALFDIEQKRAAFREAQNNKSKMRLRRDASGNYSYQFVSDEDRVATAMQDLADAQNKLYNIDKDSYKNNLDTLYRYWEEYQQKLKEAQTDEEVLKINQEYFDKMNDLIQEHIDRANNLQQTALEGLADKTKATWENLTEIEKDNLMGEIVPMWTSAWAKMASDPNFLSLFSQAGIQVATERTNYQAKIEGVVQENLGISVDELAGGEDPALKVIESAAITTEELTIELHNLVQTLEDVVKLIAGEKIDISQISTLFNKENYQLDSIGERGLSSIQEGSQAKTLSTLNTQYGWGTNSIKQTLFSTSVEKTSDALDSIMFMSETVQFMSNQLNNFYTKQSRLLEAITTDANRILKGLVTVPQAGNNNVTNINNIDANFPAVESAQEILVALTSLENQATQNAFNTYR